jgi:hypothetical protein
MTANDEPGKMSMKAVAACFKVWTFEDEVLRKVYAPTREEVTSE